MSGLLGLVTIASHNWIETAFRVDPDHDNGSLEWAIVFGLLIFACVCGAVARAEWHRVASTADVSG